MAGRPDIIVGVDFGMSQTGVAYCTAPWANPTTFQNWSGIAAEVFNKTPSRLAYRKDTDVVEGWGYFVDVGDRSRDVREFFKLHLDPDYHDEYQGMTHADAMRYYRDYLTCLHDHLVQYFVSRYPAWSRMHVEWNFSVPTTWKNAGMVHQLSLVMKQAGFGKDGLSHSCSVSLTEAEAAAVYAAGQQLQRDDVLMVCDAGGGTTDVNIMKVRSGLNEALRLDQLIHVEGREIGSALIDIAMQQHLADRLGMATEHFSDPIDTAERMMQGRFERFKLAFGAPGMRASRMLLPVPGLQADIVLPLCGIKDCQMEILPEHIEIRFIQQAERMIDLIEDQLRSLRRAHPSETVSYLVLSGGLASSAYIQGRVTSYFQDNRAAMPSGNARNMQVILAESMQLAVVQGLVRHRAQQVAQHISPIVTRCAPVSYGVVVNQRFNAKVHLGQRIIKDPRDGKVWAANQIEWLIRKGNRVNDDGVIKGFKAKLRPSQLRQPWKAHFVMSTASPDRLPQSMIERDKVRTLCVITANIDRCERRLRNQHWWNSGERHEITQLFVRLIPGYADLEFRLLSGGRLLNSEDDKVEVEWATGSRVMSMSSLKELESPFL